MPYSGVMDNDIAESVRDVFDGRTAFTTRTEGVAVTTTAFEGLLREAVPGDDGVVYTVTVRVPTLRAATADDVGDAVAADWLRTLRRRLADAPQATRADLELDSLDVEATDGTVEIEYVFTWDDAGSAPGIVKTLVEFVEGTYVEGVVPGYEYESPVADLLAQASQGEKGGTPL
jgi:hypothetical protein